MVNIIVLVGGPSISGSLRPLCGDIPPPLFPSTYFQSEFIFLRNFIIKLLAWKQFIIKYMPHRKSAIL